MISQINDTITQTHSLSSSLISFCLERLINHVPSSRQNFGCCLSRSTRDRFILNEPLLLQIFILVLEFWLFFLFCLGFFLLLFDALQLLGSWWIRRRETQAWAWYCPGRWHHLRLRERTDPPSWGKFPILLFPLQLSLTFLKTFDKWAD